MLNEPETVGVPDSSPEGLSASPAGSGPFGSQFSTPPLFSVVNWYE